MNDLGIIDLYQKNNKEKTEDFIKKIDSTLRIQTDTKKSVKDTEWIEKIEETIPYIDNIFRAPNRFIVNEEEIVKIELARKITVDSIKHLSKNTNLIQSIDKKTGDVTPSKILNINKEESYDTYENRLIYTLVQNMKIFVNNRKKTLEELDTEKKDNKKMEYNATSKTSEEKIDINLSLNSSLDYDSDNSKDDTKALLERIEALEQKITDLTSSEVYKIIDKKHITLVREPIKKTNVVLKNVNFQYAMKLWNYLRDNYDDKTTQINDNQDYVDTGEMKQLADETFMLQYLIMKTLDQDKMETQDTREQIQDNILEQMIDKMLDMNTELTGQQLKQMIGNRYEVIKYKKLEVLREIQKIFKKHIDKYLEKVEKRGGRKS